MASDDYVEVRTFAQRRKGWRWAFRRKGIIDSRGKEGFCYEHHPKFSGGVFRLSDAGIFEQVDRSEAEAVRSSMPDAASVLSAAVDQSKLASLMDVQGTGSGRVGEVLASIGNLTPITISVALAMYDARCLTWKDLVPELVCVLAAAGVCLPFERKGYQHRRAKCAVFAWQGYAEMLRAA